MKKYPLISTIWGFQARKGRTQQQTAQTLCKCWITVRWIQLLIVSYHFRQRNASILAMVPIFGFHSCLSQKHFSAKDVEFASDWMPYVNEYSTKLNKYVFEWNMLLKTVRHWIQYATKYSTTLNTIRNWIQYVFKYSTSLNTVPN